MDKINEETTKRLDIIISLLLDLLDLLSLKKGEKTSPIIRMNKLKQLGFDNREIGNIFGKSGEAVSKLLYEIKRKEKKNK